MAQEGDEQEQHGGDEMEVNEPQIPQEPIQQPSQPVVVEGQGQEQAQAQG